MKSRLTAIFIVLMLVGSRANTAELKGKEPSVVGDVDEVVLWVIDKYSLMEDAFDKTENKLRASNEPINKTLDELSKLVSNGMTESEEMKQQLIELQRQLEHRKQKIKMTAEKASPSVRKSYDLAVEKMDVKLEGTINPLLDFDFPNLEDFVEGLSPTIVEWKQYLELVDGVEKENDIRNKVADMISAHFRDKLSVSIEIRRKKWSGVVKTRSEGVQKEDKINGSTPSSENWAKPSGQGIAIANPLNAGKPQQESVQNIEKNVGGSRFLGNSPSPAPRFEMISVKPGSFSMGSPGGFFAGERGRDSDEIQHQVTLTKGFYLGKYEVTQAQWVHVMGSNPSQFKGTNRPVEEVSWNDAVAFCRKFTEMEKRAGRLPAGMAYQLPTEAQWEYACRSGTTAAFSFGQDLTSRQANILGGPAGTTEVGKYPANAWGLHDMHGNVWEWCADWYAEYPKGGVTDPTGSMKGAIRVTRGGSWDDAASDARCASRNSRAPAGSYGGLGFRLSLRPLLK